MDLLGVSAQWADIAGALGAAVAIGFAVKAHLGATKARLSVVHERRRQFELEILRDLLEDLDTTDLLGDPNHVPGRLQRYEHRLLMLPSTALPFWRQMARVTALHEIPVLAKTLDQIARAEQTEQRERERLATAGVVTASGELERLRMARAQARLALGRAVRQRMADDIERAIKQRVETVDD